MITFHVPQTALKAMMPIMPEKDVRYYLNGAFFDHTARAIVATNGHVLCAVRVPDVSQLPESIIVPAALIAHGVKAKTADGMAAVTYDYATETVNVAGLTAKVIDATYPDWREVVPATVSGEPGYFSPAVLSAARDAFLFAHGDNPKKVRASAGVPIADGRNKAAMLADNVCLVVAMPFSADADKVATRPTWIDAPAPTVAAVAA